MIRYIAIAIIFFTTGLLASQVMGRNTRHAGDAILTRPGSSHGLKQTGKEDLVIIINYIQIPK